MDTGDLFAVGKLANRIGRTASAISFYENQGLMTATRYRLTDNTDSNDRCCGAWRSSG